MIFFKQLQSSAQSITNYSLLKHDFSELSIQHPIIFFPVLLVKTTTIPGLI